MALLEYFRSIFDHDDVLEAKIALDLYGLEKHIENRDKVVQKLEVRHSLCTALLQFLYKNSSMQCAKLY